MSHTATMSQIRAAIRHYENVQRQFGNDDLSDAYHQAIGDTPNYAIRDNGTVIVYGIGGKEHLVTVVAEPHS